MPDFPSCFPDNFKEEILPKNAREERHLGYRVAKYGAKSPLSYVSTYEEKLTEGEMVDNPDDPGVYSTSLFDTPDYPKRILSITLRNPNKPQACLVKGYTEPSCGPSMVGSARKEKTRHGRVSYHHIHWWIYQDACPWEYFEKAGDEQ